MRPINSASVQAHIDLGAIEHNLNVLAAQARDASLMAIIKADAYGHGAVEVAKVLRSADGFGVSRLDEGKTLRDAGIEKPITILGGVRDDELDIAADLGLTVVVHTHEQVSHLLEKRGACIDIWLKVDSGMHRLGIEAGSAREVIAELQDAVAVGSMGVMTHLACADDPEDAVTSRQADVFASAIDAFDGDISIANSAGILGWPELQTRFAGISPSGSLWLRPGISLYGISPIPGRTAADFDLRPAMHLEAPVIAVKSVRAGQSVGYGGDWQAEQDTSIGIIAAGYGDGYSRHVPSGCPVLINDAQYPVAGRISMDYVAVDLGLTTTVSIGDSATLWGGKLPIEVVAAQAGTIAYTLVTGVTARVPRSFSRND